MKTTLRILAAGLAASLALISCDKESLTETDNTVPEGARVVTVSFSHATKSALGDDGFTPHFTTGDVIKVFKGSETEDCTVTVGVDGTATISIQEEALKTGPLTAVYPAAAWINSDPYFKVSTEQDGTFANANICKVKIPEGSKDAVFENQTAIFRITPGAGAGTQYVEVITAGPEIASFVPEGSKYDTKHKIHVASAKADEVFVSILVPSGLKIRDLSFADGSHMKTAKDNTTDVAANNLYTVTSENWSEPYVELNGLKWATRNVGASLPTEYGDYFAWGEVAGHKYENGNWTSFPSSNPDSDRYTGTWNAEECFTDCNTPYFDNDNYSTSKYNGEGLKVLELSDDAANVQWGGSWRMPTRFEFAVLRNMNNNEWHTNYNSSGVSGCTSSDGSNTVFFPAAGRGDGTDSPYPGGFGYYWSSSLYTTSPYDACHFSFIEGRVTTGNICRFYGYSVRPLSE